MRSPDVPGVARERTGLAWQRSALAFGGLAAVVLGVAARRDAPGLLVPIAALLAVAATVWRQGRRTYGRSEVAAQPRPLALLAVATALAALVAVIVVLIRL